MQSQEWECLIPSLETQGTLLSAILYIQWSLLRPAQSESNPAVPALRKKILVIEDTLARALRYHSVDLPCPTFPGMNHDSWMVFDASIQDDACLCRDYLTEFAFELMDIVYCLLQFL